MNKRQLPTSQSSSPAVMVHSALQTLRMTMVPASVI